MIERYILSLNQLIASDPVNMVVNALAYGAESELNAQFRLSSPLIYYALPIQLNSGAKGRTIFRHKLYSLVQPHIKSVNPNNSGGNYDGSNQQFTPVSELIQSLDSAHRAFLTLLNAQEPFLLNNSWAVRTISEPYTAEIVLNLSSAGWVGYVYEFETSVQDELACDYNIITNTPC
jgi:hypothetical protein